ncbi:hypothetical protein LSAT2_011584 [Lamellibrachia satsuma]|nr:hypothetical protein LSAT2_011584 [Lamellibrachia satsuma]
MQTEVQVCLLHIRMIDNTICFSKTKNIGKVHMYELLQGDLHHSEADNHTDIVVEVIQYPSLPTQGQCLTNHPLEDILETIPELVYGAICIRGGQGKANLCIICIYVVIEKKSYESDQRTSVTHGKRGSRDFGHHPQRHPSTNKEKQKSEDHGTVHHEKRMSMDIGSPDYEHHAEVDETCQSSLDRRTQKEPPCWLQEPVEMAVVEAPKATERVRYTK